MRNYRLLSLFIIFIMINSLTQAQQNKEATTRLIIRLDDIGLCHSVNMGAEKIFKTGLPVSASVMWGCPWVSEAVSILKKYPNVSIGVHLMVNSEWNNYRFGPICGKDAVPSLVDSTGYFPQGSTWFYNEIFTLEDLEKEFRAQIERAFASGLQIDYIDNHMGGGRMTPEQVALCEKLAKEYNLAISHYYEERSIGGVEGYYSNNNMEIFMEDMANMEPGLHLMVNHPGADTDEMNAMTLNSKDGSQKSVAKQRAAVVEMFSSDKFINGIKENNIELVNYRILIKEQGLNAMVKPE